MEKTFRYQDYFRDNPDLASHYSEADEAGLTQHFEVNGINEMRGARAEEFARVEGLIISDCGYALVIGWADRRILPNISLSIDVGYFRHEFTEEVFCWHRRDDVSAVIGDWENQPGFIALVKLEDFAPHPRVVVSVAGVLCFGNENYWMRSRERFLIEALEATAVLAERPISESFAAGQTLVPKFREIWRDVLETRSFHLAYETGQSREVERSIIIVMHAKYDMLLVQLTLLADILKTTSTEVIVVANEIDQLEVLAEQLSAFSQIHPINLRLFTCTGNSGFAAANNFGATKARGDVLIFMNPDIFPPEGPDADQRRFLLSDPGKALVGALLYYGDGLLMHSGMYCASDSVLLSRRNTVQSVLRIEHFGKGLAHNINEPIPDAVRQSVEQKGALTTAALWKVRKAEYEAAGCLNEDYIYAYYEDADFCMQWLEQGRPIDIDTSARFVHLEGAGRSAPPFLRVAMWLNRIQYTLKFESSVFVSPRDIDLHAL